MARSLFKKEITPQEKAAALRTALNWWNSGRYQDAMKLCKKYGVSDREFSFALVASFRQNNGGSTK